MTRRTTPLKGSPTIHVVVSAETKQFLAELTVHHQLSAPQVLDRLIARAHANIDPEAKLHERTL